VQTVTEVDTNLLTTDYFSEIPYKSKIALKKWNEGEQKIIKVLLVLSLIVGHNLVEGSVNDPEVRFRIIDYHIFADLWMSAVDGAKFSTNSGENIQKVLASHLEFRTCVTKGRIGSVLNLEVHDPENPYPLIMDFEALQKKHNLEPVKQEQFQVDSANLLGMEDSTDDMIVVSSKN